MNATAALPVSAADRARLLDAARHRLFATGFRALTMDALAHDLGMSKKTLYRHFPGKDQIVGAVIDAMGANLRARIDAVLGDARRSFAEQLCGVFDIVGSTIAQVSPQVLEDLQRFAPHLYAKIDELRQRNIPYVFGRLIRTGQAEGKIRREVDPDFAVEFWLQAVRGLVHPATLHRTQLSPRQTLERGINLFFDGILSTSGRKDYEQHLSRCQKHGQS
jgi:AcrR family transcriptional regulator